MPVLLPMFMVAVVSAINAACACLLPLAKCWRHCLSVCTPVIDIM
jgi:hypothetical protein